MRHSSFLFAWLLWVTVSSTSGQEVISVTYPASKEAGELAMEATFHLWLPPQAKRIRAVIIHQHGCGEGAERFGDLAVQDLHWRALAAEHDAALLCPHFRTRGADCSLWYDPRKGSALVLQRALNDLGHRSGHPELESAPWCVWGHSGGGIWASFLLEQRPERIVALFCRSGAAGGQGGIREANFPDAAYHVPVLLNPGLLERTNELAWGNGERFFELFRARNAPVAFAPDPFSKHDCRNSRLLAIPFFHACLKLRLPRSGQTLKPVKMSRGSTLRPPDETPTSMSWLPDKRTARAFLEYVSTGITQDRTPPRRPPMIVSVKRTEDGINLNWTAEADLESGIRQFAIYRDGKRIALWPEKFDLQTGYAQFQGISFHDTPVSRRPPMSFTDPRANGRGAYAIATINGSGLEGPRSKAVHANQR